MKKEALIYYFGMSRAQKPLKKKYGKKFWKSFKTSSNELFAETLSRTPSINGSLFAFSYAFFPAYVAWYKSFVKLGLSPDAVKVEIWNINERLITFFPKWALQMCNVFYLKSFRKQIPKYIARSANGTVSPDDWKIRYRNIDKDTFEVDIYECAMYKLSDKFGVRGMFPTICRMDYLMAYYFGNGFERTKTIGDGDDCCNCHYTLKGDCEWKPEKGFINRK